MNLLLIHATQAGRIETKAELLRPVIRIQMKMRRGVAVDMTIQAGDAEAWVARLTIIGGKENPVIPCGVPSLRRVEFGQLARSRGFRLKAFGLNTRHGKNPSFPNVIVMVRLRFPIVHTV